MNVPDLPRGDEQLLAYRREIDEINGKLLQLLNERAMIATSIARRKEELGLPTLDPVREAAILESLAQRNQGPFSNETIKALFKELLAATRELMNTAREQGMLFSRRHQPQATVVEVNGVALGRDPMTIIAGPCAVESEGQLECIAAHLAQRGVKIMRGGAYKPRTSPYSFQGLELAGLRIMRRVADRYGLAILTEVLEPAQVPEVSEYADILQVGCRNMYNYPLLREVGRGVRPVLLKRHFGATLEELLLAAEYILSEGNERVILCERGIRTFEPRTRSTLDISAIPVLQGETHLPLAVDISHPAGRRDILGPLARAVQAVGANALMVEVHHDPARALSDSQQQLSLEEFDALQDSLQGKTTSG